MGSLVVVRTAGAGEGSGFDVGGGARPVETVRGLSQEYENLIDPPVGSQPKVGGSRSSNSGRLQLEQQGSVAVRAGGVLVVELPARDRAQVEEGNNVSRPQRP